MIGVRVIGLREAQAALRAADSTFPRELSKANKAMAEEVVAEAQARADSIGGVAAKASDAIKARGEQRRALVVLDATTRPFVFGAEFGAKPGLPRQTRRGPMIGWNQFRPWRGNQWTEPEGLGVGYFLHPTIRDKAVSGELVERYDRALDELFARLFPD